MREPAGQPAPVDPNHDWQAIIRPGRSRPNIQIETVFGHSRYRVSSKERQTSVLRTRVSKTGAFADAIPLASRLRWFPPQFSNRRRCIRYPSELLPNRSLRSSVSPEIFPEFVVTGAARATGESAKRVVKHTNTENGRIICYHRDEGMRSEQRLNPQNTCKLAGEKPHRREGGRVFRLSASDED